MASKPLIWEFTPKDLVMALGFVITVVSHYYATLGAFEEYKAKTDAKLEIVNYRIGAIERSKDKQAYYEPKEAILPSSIRSRKNLLFSDYN